MSSDAAFSRYRELSRGKTRRVMLAPCAGCLRPNLKPYMYANFASDAAPVTVDYMLCKGCGKQVQNPRKKKRFATKIEENLEALGAFELSLSRGEA